MDIIPLGEDFPGGEKKGMSFWIVFIQCREKNDISILCFQTIFFLSACRLDIIGCGKYYE